MKMWNPGNSYYYYLLLIGISKIIGKIGPLPPHGQKNPLHLSRTVWSWLSKFKTCPPFDLAMTLLVRYVTYLRNSCKIPQLFFRPKLLDLQNSCRINCKIKRKESHIIRSIRSLCVAHQYINSRQGHWMFCVLLNDSVHISLKKKKMNVYVYVFNHTKKIWKDT